MKEIRSLKKGDGVQALGRHMLTESGRNSVSTREMKMGQLDLLDKEITHKPAGY